MYLSLITDLLLLLLLYLSANLLSNLTKIMIHNRMGDYRSMLHMGSRKTVIVTMILFQILLYAVFSTLFSILLCYVLFLCVFHCQGLGVLFTRVMSRSLRLSITMSFSAKTLLLALLLGLLVPLLSAIPSIHSMLHKITSHHTSSTQVIEYTISSTKRQNLLPTFVVVISILLSACGTSLLISSHLGLSIYYFLPLGFISNNMTVPIHPLNDP